MPRVLSPFYITLDPNTTTSSEFVTGSIPGISFYYPTSSYTDSLTTGSLGSIGFNVETFSTSGIGGEMVFTVPNTDGTPNTGSVVLSLGHSGSNNDPRVGIGFDVLSGEKPIKPFDIRTKSDTSEGTEILLRSSRISQGAQAGDTVGTINFIAESSSYDKYGQISLTGSVATISTIVRTIDEDGASGDIVFSTTSTGSKSNPAGEVMRLTGEGNVLVTGSINITDGRGISGQDFQLGGSGGNQGKLTVRSITQDNASYTSTFAGNVSIGTTLISHPLRVNGNSFLDGDVQLGTTQADTIDVQGVALFDERVDLSGSLRAFNLNGDGDFNPGNDTDILVTVNDYIRTSSVDHRIFTNTKSPELISRNAGTGGLNQILAFTDDTTIVTSSTNFTYNSSANTLTAPGSVFATNIIAFTVPLSVTDDITTQGSLFASLSFASGDDDNVVVYNPTTDKFYYTGSYTGPQGAQGVSGSQGAQGLQGAKGNPGLGLQGVQGTAAIPPTNISASGYISASEAWFENNLAIGGISNVSASIAAAAGGSGNQGTQGTQGTLGTTGIQGTTGTQGTAGAQGTLGTAGAQGTQGTVGAQGIQGTLGTTGAQGTQGTLGTTGVQGASGADGGVATFTNGANNRVITATGTDSINGESNLTFNGSLLTINGDVTSNGYGIVSQSGDFITNEFIVAASPYSVTSSDALAVNSDGDLGIGTPNPEVRLHMLGEAPQTTQILMEQFNDTADAPDIRTRRYRGTSASRADVQTGDYLFRLNVHGQDGGASELYGSMRFDVDGTSQDAMVWGLQTRDTGGTVADRITIDSSGDVDVAGDLAINGITNVSASIADASGGGAVATYTNGTNNRVITSTGTDGINGEVNLTFDGTTLTVRGEQEFQPSSEIRGIHYDVDSNWESTTYVSSGEYITVGTAISRTAHDLYVLGSSGWVQADADALSTSTGLLGVAVDGSSGNDFLVKGVFNVTGTVYGSPAIGDTVYVHTIAGAYTVLAPTATGDVVRAVGHIVDSFTSGRNTYWKIFFNPSPDFIEN